jgi:hypothetical protein
MSTTPKMRFFSSDCGFTNFLENSLELAQSRFTGGTHTEQDIAIGLTGEIKIGEKINKLSWKNNTHLFHVHTGSISK